MKIIYKIVPMLMALVLLNSCNKNGRTVELTCSKKMMKLQDTYFVGVGQGKSIDIQHAQELAREKARELIAEQMNVIIQKEIITKSKSTADPTSFQKDRQAKAEQLIAQRLSGLSFFCAETRVNKADLYTASVGLQLDMPKTAFQNKIKKDLGLLD